MPLRLGIAGLGTVGTGVVKLVQRGADLLAARAGRPVEIRAISARERNKDRGVDLSRYAWEEDPVALAGRADIDVVIELIGGAEGPAADLVQKALKAGKHVVTANKALMAQSGFFLAELAESQGVSLSYEASVAGGIPVIKTLREGFAGNEIRAVYGILNGTCNYILTAMRETGQGFETILREAQAKGYAEADPRFDVDGIDAAHKLCILTSLAFGVRPDFRAMSIQGIRHINATDIAFAEDLGYRIKLLGIAERTKEGLMQILEPCLVPISSPMGGIEDVYNAVYIEGDFVQAQLLTGRGAGEGPTASAVMSDVMDIARGVRLPTFGVPAEKLEQAQWLAVGETVSRFYIRLMVLDRPGVIAEVSAILKELDISIEGLLQRGRDPGQPVPIVLTTHETRQAVLREACRLFGALSSVVDVPCLIRIEDLR